MNPARPFRAVALETSRGHIYYYSAIIGPDDQIETRSCNDEPDALSKKVDKLNDLYERGYLAGQESNSE